MKKRIFISSVQTEFAQERIALHQYIVSDPLLGKFFDPFLFELHPATDHRADDVFLRDVQNCDIYLGILGREYGSEDSAGLSPTEKEFDQATDLNKTRLVFLSNHTKSDRAPKQITFIKKAQNILVRKLFGSIDELKSAVYAALIRYLEEKQFIQIGPFDAAINPKATLSDLSTDKVKRFVRMAESNRGFPIPESAPIEDVLTHLNLIDGEQLTNAAILLFGKEPQRFFISSEVRCASFHGIEVAKPIQSYKVFKGDVFELVDETVDFLLSKLDFSVGTRSKHNQIPGQYEIPRAIIAEAVVNAVAHRDYTSNGSIQAYVLADRIEISNPGSLPLGWTTEKLKALHSSIPANPLLALPMYLAGYIERLGTGTSDMIKIARSMHLKEPRFVQDDAFNVLIYKPIDPIRGAVSGEVSGGVSGEVSGGVSGEVLRLVSVLKGERSRIEIQEVLALKHEDYFRKNYIQPSLDQGYIEMSFPDNPNHPKQKYRLTAKGEILRNRNKNKRRNAK